MGSTARFGDKLLARPGFQASTESRLAVFSTIGPAWADRSPTTTSLRVWKRKRNVNDPHVVALNFRIEHHSSVNYDNASPLDHREEAFEIHVEGNSVSFTMNRHYATQSEALDSVEDYIRAWEYLAALQTEPSEFKLVFDGAKIEDRDPTPGVMYAGAKPFSINVSVSEPDIHVSRGTYPQPPSGKLEFSPDVKLMFDQYVAYRARRRYLTDMANFCLTVLENSVQSKKNVRKAAARHYDIEYEVLCGIGRLCSQKGGAEARKAQGVDQDLNGQERQFLEEVVRAIIRRAAEVAADPDGSREMIALSEFPDVRSTAA